MILTCLQNVDDGSVMTDLWGDDDNNNGMFSVINRFFLNRYRDVMI